MLATVRLAMAAVLAMVAVAMTAGRGPWRPPLSATPPPTR
jgi:hypothetical protein